MPTTVEKSISSALPEPSTPKSTTDKPPDRVPKVLGLFGLHRQGSIDHNKRWIEIRLEPEEYVKLLQTLEEDQHLRAYVQDNVP